jgi:hypothetical protein
VKHHGSNPNLDRWLAAVTAPDPRPAEEPDREARDALYAEAVAVIAAALPRSTPVGYPKRAATALERAGLLNRHAGEAAK